MSTTRLSLLPNPHPKEISLASKIGHAVDDYFVPLQEIMRQVRKCGPYTIYNPALAPLLHHPHRSHRSHRESP